MSRVLQYSNRWGTWTAAIMGCGHMCVTPISDTCCICILVLVPLCEVCRSEAKFFYAKPNTRK